ncbi:MAG TPA: hypothetical protein VKZ98_00750 [Aquaticitalea sp.]|nr:hypothetical protein [Aquaticitalea sp.]
MKTYRSLEEIEHELKRLSLERQIGLEQLKGIKGEFADDLKPKNWVGTAVSFGWKYGLFLLLKKLFR